MKLASLRPGLATLSPRIGTGLAATSQVGTQEPLWRKWYHTRKWERLRWSVLVRDAFTCQMCGRIEPDTSKLVADHKTPHRGNPKLFWDDQNIQALCANPCHNAYKQAIDRQQPAGMWDEPGGRRVSAGTAGEGAMAHPAWFGPSTIPFTVVCGPVAAGKSTYVRRHASRFDLIIDLDEIALRLFKTTAGHLTLDQTLDCLRVRNTMVGYLMRPTASAKWQRAWLVVSEPKAEHRDWWQKTTGARIVVLATPIDECIRRADADTTKTRPEQARNAIAKWWQDYTPRPGEILISAGGVE